jgi:hypothetical protein
MAITIRRFRFTCVSQHLTQLMKQALLSILFLLLYLTTTFAQNEYLPRLSINGAASELGVSPSEEIWVATAAGNVYYTPHVGAPWQLGPSGSSDIYGMTIGNDFERISVLSKDTLMISGFIQDNGKENFVYWSADHGVKWKKVVFGKSSWLDAAYADQRGRVWASGSSQLIYYSADKGQSWKTFGKVEPKGNLRFTSVHFAKNGKTGLFGSTWNNIYRTPDNCTTWQKLPTPLDQKRYVRISKENRPEISKVRIFGNYYIVNQEDRVFITKSDTINWLSLPGVINFEVTDHDSLYVIKKDLTIQLFDDAFEKAWESIEKIDSAPRAIAVKNGKLFVLTLEDNIYKIYPKEFVAAKLLTNKDSIAEPELKIALHGEKYAFDNRDILKFDSTKNRWYRYLTPNFEIGNATLYSGRIILSDKNLTKHYSLNTQTRTIEAFNLPNTLVSKKNIVGLHFEYGSQGCFHSNNARKSYKKGGNNFVAEKQVTTPEFLSNAKSSIPETYAIKLIELIDSSKFTPVTLHDLKVTAKDILGFQTFVDDKAKRLKEPNSRLRFDDLYSFPGENIDFEFYKHVADSLSNINAQDIDAVFWQANGTRSTTTNWRRLIIEFEDNEILIAENSDYLPNYLCAPWIVTYKGLRFRINSVKLGQQIEELTGGQFFDKTLADKKYAIFKIADYLYRKKLNNQ